ncbi:hypothetical protein F5ESL0263_07965 [Lactobacillus sp. ESL0263]|uniref:hypothetical protein n=1 Tax=Lactobacillus sp. ESL0263 TaxID=2069350 RepID=UPI000EFCE1D4|nr:hypothetical protein [Lactobacillus sp. ESL0263]RMC48535.1 hypothetical protein F5ESL0263_07965 [Lactobacillus sp. ESL0263]
MKKAKLIKLISLAAIFLGIGSIGLAAGARDVNASNEDETVLTPPEVAVETGNEYGVLKKEVFPKSWKGYWGGKSDYRYIIREGFGDVYGNCTIVEYGYVKGTHNYPWQMPEEWKKKCVANRLYLHATRRTWVSNAGITWAILGYPLSEPIQKDDIAITCRTETIKGKKYRVMFEANPKNFKVTSQYFRTKKLTKKYAHHQFKDMEYSAKF